MPFELPIDPRLLDIDNVLVEIVFDEFKKNVDLVGIHLRDARNTLTAVNQFKDDRVLSKATILLASAALESNLAYISQVALRFAEKRPQDFAKPQVEYLQGFEDFIDDRGQIVRRPMRQPLAERLQTVPALLARAVGRKYALPIHSGGIKKLRRTIERRDAIVHPRWEKYVVQSGWWEAAEAIDAVELYLDSVSRCMHPYMVGYFPLLYTIPGSDKHEVAVGHRTYGKRGPARKLSTMDEVGIRQVLLHEWFDSMFLTRMAIDHDTEKDSDGSMLTRAALVLLYGMLDAQLAVVSQWRIREQDARFHQAEIPFLNEFAIGVGRDGEVWVGEDQHSFKKRIKAIPAILSRRVDQKELSIDLGTRWGEQLLGGHGLRSKVMHSAIGEAMPRISKAELCESGRAVYTYFDELGKGAPISFGYVPTLLDAARKLVKELF